jgi:hypothetical protein
MARITKVHQILVENSGIKDNVEDLGIDDRIILN